MGAMATLVILVASTVVYARITSQCPVPGPQDVLRHLATSEESPTALKTWRTAAMAWLLLPHIGEACCKEATTSQSEVTLDYRNYPRAGIIVLGPG